MNTLHTKQILSYHRLLTSLLAGAFLVLFLAPARSQNARDVSSHPTKANINSGVRGNSHHLGENAPAVGGPILYIDDSDGFLGTVNVETGETTVIGYTGVILTDIAFSPAGILYGISFTSIYTIDALTAVPTFIGDHGIAEGNALVFNADGVLYAAGAGTSFLYTINPATGAGQALGDIGFASAGDLAFYNGVLYMSSETDELIQISLSTFQGTSVGPIGFGEVFGLATGDNGVLYGVAGTQVFSLNVTTGAGNLVSDYQGAGLGSAFGSSFVSESALARSVNISTRLKVQTGDNVLIGGFIIAGNGSKTILLRAIGPSLTSAGVTGVLTDPILELHKPDGTVITNNNWKDSQQTAIEATGIAPTDNLESAILNTLAPGLYTAVVRGNNNGRGVGLVEIFDLQADSGSQLANISSRGRIETADNVMIGGFILGGAGSNSPKIVARVIGPSLSAFGVTGALQDSTLDLFNVNGVMLATNDDWRDSQQAEIEADQLAPSDNRESALEILLGPGLYTVIARGKNNTTGVGLVEIYNLN